LQHFSLKIAQNGEIRLNLVTLFVKKVATRPPNGINGSAILMKKMQFCTFLMKLPTIKMHKIRKGGLE
jgi:hypothetical protein